MDIKQIKGVWEAFLEVQEKKLSPKQKKHMDQDKDGDIEGDDLVALRAKKAKKEGKEGKKDPKDPHGHKKAAANPLNLNPNKTTKVKTYEGRVECPKCKSKGYVMEAQYKVPKNFAAMMAKKRKKAGAAEFGAHPDKKKVKKQEARVDESAYKGYDHCEGTGYHKVEKEAYGSKKMKESNLFSDEEIAAIEEKADAHTKGATKPEGIMDKESPKAKEFADQSTDIEGEKHKDFDEKGHDDVSKAGRPTSQAPARKGDNLSNGDPKTPKKPTK